MKRLLLLSILFIGFGFMADQDPIQSAHEACNAYREKKHREPLTLDSFLCKLAMEHSRNMARHDIGFGHSGFKERSRQVMDSLGVQKVAENVFWSNAYEKPNGEEAVQGWIDSREHRKNMLGKSFRRVGYGYAKDQRGRTYFTQILCD